MFSMGSILAHPPLERLFQLNYQYLIVALSYISQSTVLVMLSGVQLLEN